jgi:hypothetical protein
MLHGAAGSVGEVKKPIRCFVPDATTRLNSFFSSPSWANADDESSPNASTVSRTVLIFIVRLNAPACQNDVPRQIRRGREMSRSNSSLPVYFSAAL